MSSEEVPGDLRMVRVLWPFMLASAVGLVPFTVYATFLVPIAGAADGGVAALGQLRGLGGLAALVVGFALAPLIDRVRKEWAAAGGLAILALAAAFGATGQFLLLAAFCLLVGAGTAVLNPALTAAAADRFGGGAAAGRAATLITATQSLTALLAAPLVALPAMLWGWQGDLLAVTAVTSVLALYFLLRGRRAEPPRQNAGEGPRPGYLASFRMLSVLPGVVPLLFVAMLRTAAFMGYLAYLAAFYDERFGLGPGTCVTTLLVGRCGTLRGTALSVNAAGMSFGVFLGAGAGGVGLSLGGYPGTDAALGGLTLAALASALLVTGTRPPPSGRGSRARRLARSPGARRGP